MVDIFNSYVSSIAYKYLALMLASFLKMLATAFFDSQHGLLHILRP